MGRKKKEKLEETTTKPV